MTIGVLGGGQLGRMIALGGVPLGREFVFLDPSRESPAQHVGELIVAAYDDQNALDDLASRVDVVTYEFESVPVAAARRLAERVPVYPPPGALEVAQDRLHEKQFFERLGIPTAAFADVQSRDDLARALERIGLPAVLKTRRFGYDGKGQVVIRAASEIDAAWKTIGQVPSIVEAFVRFERELSILTVRGRDASKASYALVENTHEGGILRLSIAPAPDVPRELQHVAADYAERIASELGYVGVLALELFQANGALVANEMAPRVHNSGHWTIEGAVTSQFENHVRAILGLPLGSTACVGASAMFNLIGAMPDVTKVLSIDDAHLHDYAKDAAPGRKVGHVTVRASSADALASKIEAVRAAITPSR